MGWYGLDWSGSGCGLVAGSFEHGNGFHKVLANSWIAVKLAAYEEGLSSMELHLWYRLLSPCFTSQPHLFNHNMKTFKPNRLFHSRESSSFLIHLLLKFHVLSETGVGYRVHELSPIDSVFRHFSHPTPWRVPLSHIRSIYEKVLSWRQMPIFWQIYTFSALWLWKSVLVLVCCPCVRLYASMDAMAPR
jgi:hypothetical protein